MENNKIITTITDFIDYIENNDIDTSLLSEWSSERDRHLDSFVRFCYNNDFVPGDYDSQDNEDLLKNIERLKSLTFEETRKLLGYLIRSQYWGSGIYGRSIEDGSLALLLRRVVTHMEKQA